MKNLSLILFFLISSNQLFAQAFEKIKEFQTDVPGYSYDVVDIHKTYAIVGSYADSEYDTTYTQNYDTITGKFIDSTLTILNRGIGAAYIFEKNKTWDKVQKIYAPFPYSGTEFGADVSIRGDYAFVGEKHGIDNASQNTIYSTGAVHIYKRDGSGLWNHVQTLRPSDVKDQTGFSSQTHFGWSLESFGDMLVVGASNCSETLRTKTYRFSGAVYLYQRDSNGLYKEVQRISPTKVGEFNRFGSTVDIFDNRLMITGSTNGMSSASEVYVYEKGRNNKWIFTETISPKNNGSLDGFGRSLSMDSNTVVIGSPGTTRTLRSGNKIEASGMISIYKLNNGKWNEVYNAFNKDTTNSNYFGQSVSLHNDFAVVGSHIGSTIHVYSRNKNGNWSFFQRMTKYDTTNQFKAGHFVGIFGKDIIAGSSNSHTGFFFSIDSSLSKIQPLYNSSIKCYPNPTHDHLNFDFAKIYREVYINVLNSNGQLINSHLFKLKRQVTFGIQGEAGVYFIEIIVDDERFFKKIVKL